MPKLIPLLLLIMSHILYAQQEDVEFGNVSVAELKMSRYAKDTSAAAVILFNKGSVKVDVNSYTGTIFKRHIRIKIFSNRAFDQWANMELLANRNEISQLVAATYNLVNGRVEKSELTNDELYKKKVTKGVQTISFAFSDVKEGSILEFAFTLKYEGAFLPSWQFQFSIPVVNTEYVLTGSSKFTPHLRGAIQPLHVTKKSGTYNEWRMTDVPAFKEEPLMPDKNAYISSIEFVSEYTWEKVFAFFITHESFGKILSGHKFLNKKVEELTAGMIDPLFKIKTISDYLKQTVTWNGVCDYLADAPQEVLDKKKGTSGDINLLFGTMLKKAGLNVAMVLLSTRDHGFIQEGYPSRSQFNYVICQVTVGDKEFLLDATEKFLPFDMLPGRCFNHKGFLVSNELYGWIGIEPIKREKILLTSNLTLTDAGGLKGNVRALKDGYAAFDTRKNLKEENKEKIKNIFGERKSDMKQKETISLNEIEKPLTEQYELNLEEYALLVGDIMYVNPYVFFREESNSFLLEQRNYPIDFDMTLENTSICNISIPQNYIVEEMPQNKTFTLPENAGKCTLSVTQNGNQLVTVSRLQINKTLFMQDEYPNLKEFYARIVSKMSEVIILKKKL